MANWLMPGACWSIVRGFGLVQETQCGSLRPGACILGRSVSLYARGGEVDFYVSIAASPVASSRLKSPEIGVNIITCMGNTAAIGPSVFRFF